MITAARYTVRDHMLLITRNELLARALRIQFRQDCDVTVAATAGEALALIATGRRYSLVICNMPTQSALELHAAVARRDPATAGHMSIIPEV